MAGEKVNKPIVQTQHGISHPVSGPGMGRGNGVAKMPMPQSPYIRPKKGLVINQGGQGFRKGVGDDEGQG